MMVTKFAYIGEFTSRRRRLGIGELTSIHHHWQLETLAADSVKLFKLLLIEWHRIKPKRLQECGSMGGGSSHI